MLRILLSFWALNELTWARIVIGLFSVMLNSTDTYILLAILLYYVVESVRSHAPQTQIFNSSAAGIALFFFKWNVYWGFVQINYTYTIKTCWNSTSMNNAFLAWNQTFEKYFEYRDPVYHDQNKCVTLILRKYLFIAKFKVTFGHIFNPK